MIGERKSESICHFLPGFKMVLHYSRIIVLNMLMSYMKIGFEIVLSIQCVWGGCLSEVNQFGLVINMGSLEQFKMQFLMWSWSLTVQAEATFRMFRGLILSQFGGQVRSFL